MHPLEGVADAQGGEEGILLTPPTGCLPTPKHDHQDGVAEGALWLELIEDEADQCVVKLERAQDLEMQGLSTVAANEQIFKGDVLVLLGGGIVVGQALQVEL